MDSVGEKFEFLDFEPDLAVRGLTNRILSELLGNAPSDATPFARLVKTRAGYEATLKICSLAGTFAAHAASVNPIEALESLKDRVREQLVKWRDVRFRRDDQIEIYA
jgi:hypothetical protein